MMLLNEQAIDRLAYQAGEMIGFKSGSTVPYDVAGYQRCLREPIDTARLPAWGLPEFQAAHKPIPALPVQASFAETPYPARLAGFRRRDIFGPDEIGARMQSLGIAYNDGLGNGLYESLLINRKYGLRHVLEAPILGFRLPYLKSDWPAFEADYLRVVQRWLSDLREMEAVYHGSLTGPGQKLVVLWARKYPLDLFKQVYFDDPIRISQDMVAALGFDMPPIEPQNAAERAALSRFWSYIRRKLSDILIFKTDTIRAALGAGTQVAANPHELPVLDMAGQARAYEYPAVAIRPLLLGDPIFLRHYVPYFTQLFNDTTGKPPMISVRMNLSAATPRFVPRAELIQHWYDQAVRHGAGAFYFWTRDYPPQDGDYDGPIPGNPHPEAMPGERWEATLRALGQVSNRRRYIKPEAQTAILVPFDSALLHNPEWRRIYAVFSTFTEACIHTRFVTDGQIERGGLPASVRLLVVPVLEFPSQALRRRLEEFSAQGGALWLAPGGLAEREGHPAPPLAGAQTLDEGLLNLFAGDEPAVLADLQGQAEALARRVSTLGLDTQSWVFDVVLGNLPAASVNLLLEQDPQVVFAPWQYEHGSEWIMPYLGQELA
jgi:hypothetical protein